MLNFAPFSESIHRTADALVQDTRSLVLGAGEDQTRLAGSTQMAVRNISQLADVVKQGAALIGPGQSDSQVSEIPLVNSPPLSPLTLSQSLYHPS